MGQQTGMSFKEFRQRFQTEKICEAYLFELRWPDGFVCPKCGGRGCYRLHGRREYVCKQCRRQSSVTAGTVLQRTHLPLTVWFWAIYLVARDKRGISATRLLRELEIAYQCQNLRSDIRFAIRAEFSLSAPGITPESGIWTDRGNGTGNLINDVLDSIVTKPAVLKEAGADKTIFQGSNQLSGVGLTSIFVVGVGPGSLNRVISFRFGNGGYIGKMNAGPEILADCVGGIPRKVTQLQLIFQNVIFGFYRPAAEVQGHKLLIGQVKKVRKESLRFTGRQ